MAKGVEAQGKALTSLEFLSVDILVWRKAVTKALLQSAHRELIETRRRKWNKRIIIKVYTEKWWWCVERHWRGSAGRGQCHEEVICERFISCCRIWHTVQFICMHSHLTKGCVGVNAVARWNKIVLVWWLFMNNSVFDSFTESPCLVECCLDWSPTGWRSLLAI